MDFSDFEYSKDKIPDHFTKKKLFFEELKNKFHDEIVNDESCKDYFKTYEPDSVKAFILEYAERKAKLAEHYEYYVEASTQTKEVKYREETESMLNLIRQKKLFNLQLEWRADKIKINEIRVAYDFEFWGQHIDSCPFIPRITEAEISVMQQFLRSENYEEVYWYELQNYEFVMEKDETGSFVNMPEWFEFYDGIMGTGSLLLLPDIRGKKEEYYMEKAREERAKMKKDEPPKDPPAPYIAPPPTLIGTAEEKAKFAGFFEKDKHFIELFKFWQAQCTPVIGNNDIDRSEIDEAIDLLEEADYKVIMPGGLNWREAIVLCARQYMNNIIANELPAVYDEYLMLTDLGISKGPSQEEIEEIYLKENIASFFLEGIKKGRKACGEPEDFNF
ncbi:MAG TPA: hypothetical protein VIH57_11650 [Bacteroidales bacterium]